jgi:hypothetical protein
MKKDGVERQELERTVTLPESLVNRVEARLTRSHHETVDEYIAFVLREVLTGVEERTDQEYEGVDEQELERRLESPGYLDS